MSDPAREAMEELRAIRSMMEKATLYRALSGSAALAAGLLTLLVCAALAFAAPPLSPWRFTGLWLLVLAAATGVNLRLLRAGSAARGEPFFSSGMRLSLGAFSPPMVVGFFLGALAAFSRADSHADIAAYWTLFYGLALLAMGSVAPRSIIRLGRAFLLLGFLAFLPPVRSLIADTYTLALLFMGAGFGALHVAYGVVLLYVRRHGHGSGFASSPPPLSADP